MTYEKTYWNCEGKFEVLNKKLEELIPTSGSVEQPRKNRKLEKFRKASNSYYDYYNNGLCNSRSEFRNVFGFSAPYHRNWSMCDDLMTEQCAVDRLEDMMNEIILEAGIEQGLI